LDGTPHVELRGLSKRYGAMKALDDVSLSIARQSIHALVGENGAGKSTLGKIIAGVTTSDSGTYLLDGEEVAFSAPRQALARGVTMISQELMLVPTMSVLDNVFLGRLRRRNGLIDRRQARREFRELCDHAGFSLEPSAPVGALRVADQQKVEILRAFARDARLIVLDEPTAALSRGEVEQLFRTVYDLRASGVTIVYVSHFLDDVLELCDTVSVLKDGAHVRTRPADAETSESLVEGMLGRRIDLAFPAKTLPAPDAPEVCRVEHITCGRLPEDVSFSLRRGEILGIAGLVGSGRTELARAIFGAKRCDRGTVTVEGRAVRLSGTRDPMRHGMALVPEDRKAQGLLAMRPTVQNVTLPHLRTLTRAGMLDRREERRRAVTALDQVGVRRFDPAAEVRSLSGGNQQKVMFAKSLLAAPKVLIVDEPTRGVDVAAKLAIYELLVELARDGLAIVLISSELEEVIGLAHRVLVMRNGRVVRELDHVDIEEQGILDAAFGRADNPTLEDMQG
jgi:ABC-type sugar transport system ATPase subunit